MLPVVRTFNTGCRPGNEPIYSKDFWTFETSDVTPPEINFVNDAERRNENVTVSWGFNEENVTVSVIVEHIDTNTNITGK